MMIKAIETVFDGYRFRSRLEARWAVFFKTLGVKFEYEKEGYDLDGVRYLPDFWLPDLDSWFEVKGQKPTYAEREKALLLAYSTGKRTIIAYGNVGENDVFQFCPQQVTFMGDAEERFAGEYTLTTIDQCPLELHRLLYSFIERKIRVVRVNEKMIAVGGGCKLKKEDQKALDGYQDLLIAWVKEALSYGVMHEWIKQDSLESAFFWGIDAIDQYACLGICPKCTNLVIGFNDQCGVESDRNHYRLLNAYTAARQARFERGK